MQELNLVKEIGWVDGGIIVAYFVLIVLYGLYHSKRKSSEEYFLAGRNMTWPIVGISLFAANISSSTLVGLAGDAFKTNTHVYNYEWFAVVVLIFFAIFFLPFYLRSKVYTMPEFLERRYDSRSRYYFSFITIVGNVLIDTAAGLYVGNIILKLIFPELDTSVIIIILAFAAAAYTIPGGLNSVIQTEVIQAVLLIIGSCILTVLAFNQVGGWDAMIDGLNAKHTAGELALNADQILSLARPEDDEFMPLSGLLIGVPILGFYFWANNQFMVQRVLGAKDLNHGRWGALFAGLLKLPVIFIMVIPGTLAILLYSGLDISELNYQMTGGEVCQDLADCPNATYPLLLFNLLPVGLLGLVLAGLLAAMMSSVSATFNSASTLITMDFVKKLRPEISDAGLVRAGQIATLVLVVLASLWAPQIERFDSLFKYLQLILSYICPPVVAVFILGLFWKRMNSNGSIVALLTGFVMAIILIITSVNISNYKGDYEAVAQNVEALSSYLSSDKEGTVEFVEIANKKSNVAKLERYYETKYTAEGKTVPQVAVDFMADKEASVYADIKTAYDAHIEKMPSFLNRVDSIHFLHMTALLTLICALIHIIVSLMTPAPAAEKLDGYTYSRSFFEEDTASLKGLPWYKNFRILAIILLVITVILVGWFW